MLIISQTQQQIKPSHTDALDWQRSAYRAAKALGWRNVGDEMHPTDRTPVFRLGARRDATIRRDRSGQADWIVEIDGQARQISTSDLGAITAELTADEPEADPFDAIADATLRALAADLVAEGYDQGRAIRAALIVERDDLTITEQDASIVRATCQASAGNRSVTTGAPFYRVDLNGDWTCDCPDHEYRGQTCKHILAAIIARRQSAERRAVAQRKLADLHEAAARRNGGPEEFDSVKWALRPDPMNRKSRRYAAGGTRHTWR